jgi:hypothetical protein
MNRLGTIEKSFPFFISRCNGSDEMCIYMGTVLEIMQFFIKFECFKF